MKPLWQPEHDGALLDSLAKAGNTSGIAEAIRVRTGREFSDMAIRRRIDRLRRRGHNIGPVAGLSKRAPMPNIDTERFWSKVDRTVGQEACWLWLGFCDSASGGYGRFRVGDGMRPVHRVAYELSFGPIPLGGPTLHGTCVLHKCDNPRCVNPSHLMLGSQIENIADRHAKGRTHRGTKRRRVESV